MTTLIELVNAPQGKRILMEMFKGNRKVAEDDISDKTPGQLKQAIEIQKMLGRTWTYETINLKNGR